MGSDYRTAVRVWLEQETREGYPGKPLPPDREMVTRFGLSARTLSRIMQECARQGLVVRIPGRGTFLPELTEKGIKPVKEPETAAVNLAKSIFNAICSGEYRQGEGLPPVKFLSYRFKVADRTVSRAYRILLEQGHVTRAGKSYWVGSFRCAAYPAKTREVFLFNYQSSDFSKIFREDMFAFAYQRLERELLTYGYRLRFESTGNLENLIRIWVRDRKIPDGLIFFTMNHHSWPGVARELNRCRRQIPYPLPPVVLDWGQGYFKKEVSEARLFSRRNIITQSVRALARYLVRNNCRRVSFFVEQARPSWRYLDDAFPLARIYQELQALDKSMETRQVMKQSRPGKKNARQLRNLMETQYKKLSLSEPRGLNTPYMEILDKVTFCTDYIPLFRDHTDSEVWIFSSDDEAARAVTWARSRGIKVPARLGVIGLENDPAYYHLGLSYCGPDWENIGYLMAHAVIGDFPLPKTSRGFVRTRALLLEKQTTR